MLTTMMIPDLHGMCAFVLLCCCRDDGFLYKSTREEGSEALGGFCNVLLFRV